MNRTTLCVLAGGRSRRFGAPKTNITIDGMPLCAWLTHRLRPTASTVCLSTASPWPPIAGTNAFDRIITDRCRYAGPLAGMLSVVDALPDHDDAVLVFVTADMPLVAPQRIRQLVATVRRHPHLAGVMNRWLDSPSRSIGRASGIEPFPSAWRISSARQLFRQAVTAGIRGPHRLASRRHVATLTLSPIDAPAFLNINTPEDLERFKRLQHESHITS